jgi:hypothetical protein
MAAKTGVQILSGYFNTGDGKVTTTEFAREIKGLKEGLGPDAYREFVEAVAKVTGDELRAA